MKRFKSADEFYEAQSEWKDELFQLREILNETELTETVKWGMPVYTIGGKNVVGTGSFKSYFGIWFYQGVFLGDPAEVLINAQEGKTKAMRQWRMSSGSDLDKKLILEYVEEAIQNQKAGKEMKPEKKKLILAEELKNAFATDAALKESFQSLTPGKQREYSEYILEAKQEKTKLSRLEKISPMIREGKGLNDRYK